AAAGRDAGPPAHARRHLARPGRRAGRGRRRARPARRPAGPAGPRRRGHRGPDRSAVPVSVLSALLRKELRLELRTFESVPGMVLFSVTIFVVFHFGLDRASVEGDLAAGILVVTLLFAGMLGLNRLYVADEEQGG